MIDKMVVDDIPPVSRLNIPEHSRGGSCRTAWSSTATSFDFFHQQPVSPTILVVNVFLMVTKHIERQFPFFSDFAKFPQSNWGSQISFGIHVLGETSVGDWKFFGRISIAYLSVLPLIPVCLASTNSTSMHHAGLTYLMSNTWLPPKHQRTHLFSWTGLINRTLHSIQS